MRSFVYVLAAVAAAGIAFVLSAPPADTPAVSSSATLLSGPAADAGTLTLRVEDMHCEHGCFPKVQETLEGLPQVVSVVLDRQAEEGTLDNPQVVVQFEPGFDLSAAQSQLAKKGFARSSLVP